MAIANYGVVRGATVAPEDVEIFYIYTPTRDTTLLPSIGVLSATDVLTPYKHNAATPAANTTELFGGLYNMKLPSAIFQNLGIYSIVIRPKEIRMTIADCGVLASNPNVKGIVLDTSKAPSDSTDKFANNAMTGYRIEYLNTDGSKRQNLFRTVTSANLCEPVNSNLTNSSQKAIRYRFNDAGSLLFLTLSPSTASSVKANNTIFIGEANQKVIITNTFFDPVVIEVEVVEYDLETLSYALYGDQSKSIDDGIYTIYDKNGNIFKQFNLEVILSEYGDTLYELRTRRDIIDPSKTLDNILNLKTR